MQHQSKRVSVPQLKQPHSTFPPLYTTKLRIDFQNKSEKERQKKNKTKKTHHAAWQDTQPLSPLHEGSPTEVVARLLEHEALTALPKANFNLFQWNGIGDVW